MADTLPVPADDQQPYLHIQPAATPLDTTSVTSACRRLHTLADPSQSVIDRLNPLATTRPPTIECLFVRPEATTDRIDCYWTLHDTTATIDRLEDTLQTALPDEYQFTTRVGDPLADLQRDTDSHVTGVEYTASVATRQDWQTALVPFGGEDGDAPHTAARSAQSQTDSIESRPVRPLETVLRILATCDCPAAYQVCCYPYPNWRQAADERTATIELGSNRITGTLFANPSEVPIHREPNLTPTAQARHDAITARDPTRSFVVNARAVAVAPAQEPGRATSVADRLATAFDSLSGQFHEIGSRMHDDDQSGILEFGTPPGQQLFEDMRTRTLHDPTYERIRTRLPGSAATSTGIIADSAELPQFCLVDGERVPTDVARALETVAPRQTTLPRPPDTVLDRFETDGLTIGRPQTQDGATSAPIAIPPTAQRRHLAWFGTTGSGKSTGVNTAVLDNFAATAGPEILIDRKGGRMAEAYCRSHYARYGDLKDVYYFDCAEWLPALSFFDIRGELEAGVPREVAVENRVGHFEEILAGVMGAEQYGDAKRSPAVIKNVLTALYDPVHGADRLTIDDLLGSLRRMHQRRTPPAVSDESLKKQLESDLPENDSKTFERIMHGAKNRVEELVNSTHLERLFAHAPAEGAAFDFRDLLDEDAVVIIDVGRLRSEVRQGVTLVVLSQLWTALRRRHRRAEQRDHPLVNLYLEEAADIASTGLLDQFLQRAREFDCALTLAMQFPGQLQEADEATYGELLNNIGTYVVGQVGLDHDLAHRLSTDRVDKEAVANRLRGLSPGEWLVDLPARFGGPNPEPFVCTSCALPRGHPDSQAPAPDGVESGIERCHDRTRLQQGLEIERPSVPETDTDDADDPATIAPGMTPILAWTSRLPDAVAYDPETDALDCTACASRYDPTSTGMEEAIACCHSLDAVDRADIPVCQVTLKRDPEAVENCPYTPKQLAFLQVVYDAQQQRHAQLEYDIVWDSMLRLKEYVDIADESIDELESDGLLTKTDHPHRLYSVTADGRDVLGEDFSYGSEYGHGKGDLDESSQHTHSVEVVDRVARQCDLDVFSEAVEFHPYYELGEHELSAAAFMGDGADAADAIDEFDTHRLDFVGLDEDGDIVVTVEVERINHDLRRAAPEDFDKMAACDPAEALWITMSHTAGHEVLDALRDPLAGEPRVEKTYADSTPVSEFRIDQPGFTAMRTVAQLRNLLDEP